MSKQIIFGGTGDSPLATGVEYSAISGMHYTNFSSTEVNFILVVPTAGVFKNFKVRVVTAPGSSKKWTFTIRKGLAATPLTMSSTNFNVEIANIETVSSTPIGKLTELSFAAGDTISFSITPTGTPTATASVFWSIEFVPEISGETIIMGNTGSSTTLTTNQNLFSAGGVSSTEFRAASLFPTSGTVKKLRLLLNVAPGVGTSRTITHRKNASDQALLTTISNTDISSSDLTNSYTVAAGDYIASKMSVSGVPAATSAKYSCVFVPTVEGEFCVASVSGAILDNTQTTYVGITGQFNDDTIEIEQQALSAAATTCRKIQVLLDVDPGVAPDAYSFTLRKNAADTSLTVTIPYDTTSGNASTDVAISGGDLLSTKIVPLNTPSVQPYAMVSLLFFNDSTQSNFFHFF